MAKMTERELQNRALRYARLKERQGGAKSEAVRKGSPSGVDAVGPRVDPGGRVAPAEPVGGVQSKYDRITFSAPIEAGLRERLEELRRRRGDRSISETIRALIEEGLKK